MKRLKIKATFISKDNSLHYNNGEEYTLQFCYKLNCSVTVEDINKKGIICMYSDIIKFFENWNYIEIIK